jgi:hypothetical protein
MRPSFWWLCLLLLLWLLPACGRVGRPVEKSPESCGKPRRVPAFTVRHGGHDYLLPASVMILKGGVPIYEDQAPTEWLEPYKGVLSASFGKYLLLQTFEKDCIGAYQARLFVVSPEGRVLHQPVWTSHWIAGFFVHGGKLTYWSEWFCRAENPERQNEESYVYVFSEERAAFERMTVGRELFCRRASPIRFLQFKYAEEWPPQRHD